MTKTFFYGIIEEKEREVFMEFCGIHNHTEYSNIKLRDCIVKLPDLINRAICYGYKGIAITDHEVISGHVQALELQDSLREDHPDFKIILGNEIYLIDKQDYQVTNKFYHFLLDKRHFIRHNRGVPSPYTVLLGWPVSERYAAPTHSLGQEESLWQKAL